MLAGYIPWIAAVTLVVGIGTWALLTLWDRHVRREEAETLRLVEEREAAAARAAREAATNAERHRALAEASAIVLWRADAKGQVLNAEGWTALTGQPMAAALGEGWATMLHPDDRATALKAWRAALRSGGVLDVEYRVRTATAEGWRWCRSRGVPVGHGADGEWVGVLEDVDDRRSAEERRLLIAREVDHRAKNVLAVVQTIVRMSSAETPEGYAAAVWARVASLARAHELLAEGGWAGAGLRAVVERELAAYRGQDDAPGSVMLDGPSIPLLPVAVQPIAMVLHELATNATKGGSLSSPGGRVTVQWWLEGNTLRLRWAESGGPTLSGPPARPGFGTRLIDATVRGQLGGALERHWESGGLVLEIRLPLARVSPAEATAQAA